MNEFAARIMDTKCRLCSAKIKRDVHVPRFGGGQNVIKWKCSNDKCPESYWHLPIGWNYGDAYKRYPISVDKD